MMAFAALLLAVNIGKFTRWADSPQGYFMTKSERAEWSRLTTEAGAAQFVDRVLAQRGEGFVDEVALQLAPAGREGLEHGSRAGRPEYSVLHADGLRERPALAPPNSYQAPPPAEAPPVR